jgi:15-cis-phytoene synthase
MDDLDDLDDHFKYCAALVREADRDRFLATLFAPAGKRDALFALYAFNVEISRVRALAREVMPAEIRLQWWRDVVLGERAGEAAANPVAAALLATLSRYSLPAEGLIGLIETRRFDVYDEPMASLVELEAYASKGAAPIFELAAHVLIGRPTHGVVGIAAQAGQAQTIAGILALLPQHAARHQLYVPLDILRHHGAKSDDIFAMQPTPGIRAALADLRLRGRRHLTHVGSGSGILKAAKPAFLSLAPLWQWLVEMERPDYEPFQPPQIPLWRRQWRIWRAAKSFPRIGS